MVGILCRRRRAWPRGNLFWRGARRNPLGVYPCGVFLRARLAIVPLQDFLGLGSEARMNTPSLSNGNWGWRYVPDALTKKLAEKIASLSFVCDRRQRELRVDQQGHGEVREDFAA